VDGQLRWLTAEAEVQRQVLHARIRKEVIGGEQTVA
jgi:hypothetical protein